MDTRKTALRLLLIVPALIAVLVVFGDGGAAPHASTAEATGSLTVGLDMQTCGAVVNPGNPACASIDPGVYGTTLPRFDKCVDVKTTVNNGVFYIDVFALNTTQLVAFSADVAFTAGKMQIQQTDVTKFLGSGASNYSNALPDSDGSYEAVGVDTGGSGHTGSGVLVRLQAQAFVPPAGGIVIPFTISTDPPNTGYPGVVLTANDGSHPGDTNGDGVYDGPFINATTGQIAVNRPDADGDGVSDTCDNCPSVPNGPAQANVPHVGNQLDTDGDGTGDACDTDIDGDGILNGADDCPYVYDNPQNPAVCLDSDGDGIVNGVDNCPNVYNPNQLDTDGDGIGDACDPDIDNDGVLNAADNCPLVANPTQADFNHNGIGDACQDSDSDGILDSVDNCPGIANNSQLDTDGDHVGDICDNCPNAPNANQFDQDHDFVGDVCDSDIDGDGIPNVSDPDIDGDGATNVLETYVGTNPNQHCAATTTPNDEAVDSSPWDTNNDRLVSGGDFLKFAPVYGHGSPGHPPLATADKRYDLNMDGKITGGDFLTFAPYYGKTCTP